MGFQLPAARGDSRSWRKAHARRHALHPLWKRGLCVHGPLLVPGITGRRSGRIPHLCQLAERRKDFVSETPEEEARRTVEEPPPFLGRWRNVYIFVVCYLAVMITGFYFFSRAYAP